MRGCLTWTARGYYYRMNLSWWRLAYPQVVKGKPFTRGSRFISYRRIKWGKKRRCTVLKRIGKGIKTPRRGLEPRTSRFQVQILYEVFFIWFTFPYNGWLHLPPSLARRQSLKEIYLANCCSLYAPEAVRWKRDWAHIYTQTIQQLDNLLSVIASRPQCSSRYIPCRPDLITTLCYLFISDQLDQLLFFVGGQIESFISLPYAVGRLARKYSCCFLSNSNSSSNGRLLVLYISINSLPQR